MGAGNVGGLPHDTLKALGVEVIAYDPNVAAFNSQTNKHNVWQQDVVSLHTPITRDGEHATLHLVDENCLKNMKADACLINSVEER